MPIEEVDFSKPMPHAIMGQCIYPFEALDDGYGSKLHSVSQSTDSESGRVAKRIYSWAREGGRRHAKAGGLRAGERARSLPPSFLKEERDSTVFVASPRGRPRRSAAPPLPYGRTINKQTLNARVRILEALNSYKGHISASRIWNGDLQDLARP